MTSSLTSTPVSTAGTESETLRDVGTHTDRLSLKLSLKLDHDNAGRHDDD